MPSRKDSPNRSETFGRLLSGAINSIATYEGKTAPIIEEELGSQMHLAGKTIQRYKAGYLPPEDRTVEVLAEAAIKRGYLGREWLGRFLHAARYPFADKLLDRLCPISAVRPRPPRVYHNLPAPTYSQFVMRRQAFSEVIDGLQQRSAMVLIVGLGGNGKTSLAREVAVRCLLDEGNVPRFDAVVWVSDKDRPGTTNLSVVLDEIARTLDYPGFTQFAHDEKLYEVGQLLKRQRVLVVVDNFETITDGALLTWLLRLPEPSKAIITTREYHREYRRGGWPVELRGMTDDEVRGLIIERLRVLRIAQLVSDQAQLEPLLAATGGSPKAIEIALGLVKYERRPLQQVVEDLHAARGNLFDDLFTRAWELLDDAAQRVLLAMDFFPASTSAKALAATADVQSFSFDRAAEQLIDLALLDVQQSDINNPPRYTLHALVRSFVRAKIRWQSGFEVGARERWVDYFYQIALQCDAGGWKTPYQFDLIERDIDNLENVMQYCYENHNSKYLTKMVLILNDFWYTRGQFQKINIFIDAALRVSEINCDVDTQIQLLCNKAIVLSFQGIIELAIKCYNQAEYLLASTSESKVFLIERLNRAKIKLCWKTGDVKQVFVLAQQRIDIAKSQGWQRGLLYKYDIAEYFYFVGRYDEAMQLLHKLIPETLDAGYHRAPIRGWIILANIALFQGHLVLSEQYIKQAQDMAIKLIHRRYLADINRVWAKIHIQYQDILSAQQDLRLAAEMLEIMGMHQDLIEVSKELRILELNDDY